MTERCLEAEDLRHVAAFLDFLNQALDNHELTLEPSYGGLSRLGRTLGNLRSNGETIALDVGDE